VTSLGKQLQSPSAAPLTPEDVLALWLQEQDTLAAIRQGLSEVDADEGMSLDEFERQARAKFGSQKL
jgi:hypothetical protein